MMNEEVVDIINLMLNLEALFRRSEGRLRLEE